MNNASSSDGDTCQAEAVQQAETVDLTQDDPERVDQMEHGRISLITDRKIDEVGIELQQGRNSNQNTSLALNVTNSTHTVDLTDAHAVIIIAKSTQVLFMVLDINRENSFLDSTTSL